MSFQKTIEESIRQLQEWIRFLEAERERLRKEIQRIQEAQAKEGASSSAVAEAGPPSQATTNPAPDEDEWL